MRYPKPVRHGPSTPKSDSPSDIVSLRCVASRVKHDPPSHANNLCRTTAHDGREPIGPHVEGFALLFGVVVLDVDAERDTALGHLTVIDNRADVQRRYAHLGKVSADRAPQIVSGPIRNGQTITVSDDLLSHLHRVQAGEQATEDGGGARLLDERQRHVGERDNMLDSVL